MRKNLLIFIILILFGCSSSYKTVTTSEVYNAIGNEDIIILDVRTEEEYNLSHIESSINIPLDEIEETIDISKDKTIYVYCQSGNRSKMASNLLIDLGYTSVHDMGGIIDWPYELENGG